MMSEQTTYAYYGEEIHAINGRYTDGNCYLCIQDDSLLDTQILLIDDDGKWCWEHVCNFRCSMTPYRLTVYYDIVINDSLRIPYQRELVWYEERSREDLECFINHKSKYRLEINKMIRK